MLLALVMLLSTMIPSFTANAAFSDVDDNHPYKEAISTLSTLDVINGYDDGTFAPDNGITRAEFTKMIVYMLGMGAFSTPITEFPDVPQSHWANANIKTAYDLGIINGFDDATFRPDDPVTYEQALKMVVCTLGYQPYAEQLGGYPDGYIKQADALKLSYKVVNTGYSQNATRGVIAQIMFNALEVEKHENVNGTWQASGKTLLNDYLNVQSLKGVLVGVEKSTTSECTKSLTTGEMCVKETVSGDEYVIDFSSHEITAAELIDMLGSTVQVYYRKDRLADDKWLVEIDNEVHSNTDITITSNDITEFSGNSLKYRPTGDKNSKTLKLDTANLSIRYNGRAVSDTDTFNGNTFPDALDDLLNPSSSVFMYGTVRAVSGSNSDTITMLDIYNYETIVAQSSLKTSDYKVTDKLTPSTNIVINPSSKLEYTFTLTRNGSEVEPTKIAANDVINYAVSLDGTYKTVKATSTSVSGRIDTLNTSKQTLTINGKTYNYSDYFADYLESKEQRTLAPDMDIKAYTDSLGTLQWATVTSSASYYSYAYVINGFDEADKCYLQMFAPSSTSITSFTNSTVYKVKTSALATNVKVDGFKKSPTAALTALREKAAAAYPSLPDSSDPDFNTTDYNQLIKVGFNSSGEINTIITIDPNEGTENNNTSKLIRYSTADTALNATTTAMKNGSTTVYSIKSSTPLFVIPADRTNEDGYALKGAISSSSMVSGSSYHVEAFDLNTSKYPTCMLIYGSSIQSGTPITIDTKYSLVADNVYDESDSLGEVFQIVDTFTQADTKASKKIASTSDFSALKKGDLALFGYDAENNANDYEIAIKYADVKNVLDTDDYSWSNSKFEFKKVSSTTSSTYTKASVYNVLQALYDENKLYVTKDGFDANGVNIANSYDTINITSSTVLLRYDADEEEFTPYAVDSSEKLTINDIVDAENSGTNCSKVLVVSYHTSSTTPTIRFIVIYE